VESSLGMTAAKMVNDTCWSHFGQVEAFKVSKHLGLSLNGGLEALERALHLELYSTISAHTATWEKDGSLVFTINECRVQSSRRRKEMDDYPCKSAGMTQYTRFAQGIDPCIKTECVYCPPDAVRDDQFCAWRFSLPLGERE
jgi:hypothetical protein